MMNIDLKFDKRWQHVVERDRAADGSFVLAVKTTGIYCRPSCPARLPLRKNVQFYDMAEAAEHAGFRACLRCKPGEVKPIDSDHELVRNVCGSIAENEETMPTLETLAAQNGLSAPYLQRRFKFLMGISPKAYGDELRRRRVRALLKNGDGVAGALYEAGYGSSSRLYENADSWLGMTPASYARGGKGAVMNYVITDCPLGRMIVAATERGISFLGFGDDDEMLVTELKGDFPNAEIGPDDGMMAAWIKMIMDDFDHHVPRADLPLDVRGTAFQARVWQALCDIAPGQTMTYGEIAESLGKPKAARAVGRACATNPVSLIVPCHRAVGSSGSLTGYRWGVPRKRKLLETERQTGEG
ncbi:MAG: bifunctional DNA-binding transcriptional regulator/O6-methylguanine-DNA methyltransferase Ada [Rhodospirillales bacterium]|jgi:AraC family transcriptional regulator, regulatory protein of adaptative response / methylated-DNA-[protein]-cysteine methyltransferase|nr:bifunctional DNA-binding transcriptional regulator/O6-methylguanine-DNA methyltransferase Ada [Rhodospirillales bacterium]